MSVDSKVIEQEIREAFAGWREAWNQGDMDGYLAGYHNSPELRIVYNMHIMHGYESIAGMNRSRFDSVEKMGQLSVEQMDVDVIGATDALAFGIMKRDHGTMVLEATFTAHLRKIEGQWFIVSEHGATD